MRRVVQSEEISLPEENFGGNPSVFKASRRRSRTVRRRKGRSERSDEEPNCDSANQRLQRNLSSCSRQRGPSVVVGIPNCGGHSAVERLGTLRRCGANLSFTAMLLLWSSGLLVGAAVCFVLVAAGIVPNQLNWSEKGGIFPKTALHTAPSPQTALYSPELQVIHEAASAISPDLTASNGPDAWNHSKALDNIPAWETPTVVSKPESSAEILSAAGSASSNQPTAAPSIGPAHDWPPIPVEKNPSDIYLGAAENTAPDPAAPSAPNVSSTVPANSAVPEVNDWNQLAAASVSVSKNDPNESAPMKNQINRFDSVTAEIAASEDFYRQAYRQGESAPFGTAAPAQPSNQPPHAAPNAPPADVPAPNAAPNPSSANQMTGTNGLSQNEVFVASRKNPAGGTQTTMPQTTMPQTTMPQTATAPVKTALGGSNFAGYQIRSTQAATAMQTPASSYLR